MTDFRLYKDITYKIIGAAMKVHSNLSWGLLEPIYQEALHLELKEEGIESEREKEISCFYKHHLLEKKYKADLMVGDVIVELKSVKELIPGHRAQLFNYMRLTKKPVGLLLNFGCDSLHGERYGYDIDSNECFLIDRSMNIVFNDIDWYSEYDAED